MTSYVLHIVLCLHGRTDGYILSRQFFFQRSVLLIVCEDSLNWESPGSDMWWALSCPRPAANWCVVTMLRILSSSFTIVANCSSMIQNCPALRGWSLLKLSVATPSAVILLLSTVVSLQTSTSWVQNLIRVVLFYRGDTCTAPLSPHMSIAVDVQRSNLQLENKTYP